MTSSTTRHTSPAAPRTGRSGSALPKDPGLDAILADAWLGPTAKLIAVALVKNWAWVKDHAWPCDQTIAQKIGRSPGHVQRCLRELEQAGYIAREPTDEVPGGRRIWLLWRCPGGRAGAQGVSAPAREAPAAPARSEQVVVVTREIEPEIRPALRPRPEAAPTATAVPDPTAPPVAASLAEEPASSPAPPPAAQEPCGTLPATRDGDQADAPTHAALGPAGGLPGDSTPSPAPDVSGNAPTALDLGAIGHATTPVPASSRIPQTDLPASLIPSSAPAASWAPRRKRLGLGLDLAELVKVVGETADPILAAELARLTAPPAPPEPPPQSLPTAELFAKLPGRHDLIAAATQRLAEATGDVKAASWSFFQKAVEAVVRRTVSPEVLQDCHRQATGPRAKDAGKVFVVAWKREVQMRC